MRTKKKNVIAGWLLFFFVGTPFVIALSDFIDSLKRAEPWTSILLRFGFMLVVAFSGIFLFTHFVRMQDDLKYYKGRNRQEEQELQKDYKIQEKKPKK